MTRTEINQIDDEGSELSDSGCPVRPIDRMTKIDRIDNKGDIREHLTRDGRRTICGLSISGFARTQPPCGNRSCKRCEKIAARLSEIIARAVVEAW